MSEPDKPIRLGLTSEANAPIPQAEFLPAPEALQFRKAERAPEPGNGPPCVICSKRIVDTYYHAQGQVACPVCAKTIEAGQNAPPAHTLLRSFFYGLGAALAGTALYSITWIVTDYQLALIAILIGFMVGKAVRHASKGLGGRPQQILAVLLTYFSITTSFIPVFIYHQMQKPKTVQTVPASAQAAEPSQANEPNPPAVKQSTQQAPNMSIGRVMFILLGIALATLFLALGQGAGSILTLVIIFFGLQRAWRMTGRSNVLVMGPYQLGS